jgi:hypothetical protein
MKLGPFQIQPQRVVIFIVIAVALLLIMDFNSRLEELARLENERATVSVRGTAVVVTQYSLQTQQAIATSPAAAEAYAREQAHLAQPGDHIIVPIPQPGLTPTPQLTPAPAFYHLSNWEVWMAFLFGK